MIRAVEQAFKILKEGGVIIYPTDTVWAIGCDATNPKAVEKLIKINNSEGQDGMIVIVDDFNLIGRYVRNIPPIAIEVVEVSDKPLTIIYPDAVNLAPGVAAKDGSIGIRVASHPFCNLLLSKFRRPVVATTPNLNGRKSSKCLNDLNDELLESVDWVADPLFDEGSTGKPSSIIYLGEGGVVKVLRD